MGVNLFQYKTTSQPLISNSLPLISTSPPLLSNNLPLLSKGALSLNNSIKSTLSDFNKKESRP